MQLRTMREVAKQYAVSPATIRRLVETGQLPAVRINRAIRIADDDLVALIRRRTTTRSFGAK